MQTTKEMRIGANDTDTSVLKWIVVGLLGLGTLIAYVDRASLSVLLTVDDFKNTFHLTDKDRGLLNGAFFFAYALAQIPGGWVVDRFGVRWPYAACFFLWSLAAAATAFTGTAAQLFGTRFALGLGEAAVAPASSRWIRANIPEEDRGLAMSLYIVGVHTGLALGAPMMVALIAALGWRWMFLVLGLGSMLWLIPWLLLVKSEHRAEILPDGLKEDSVPLGDLLRSKVFLGLVLGAFANNYFFYFCMTWMPAYFVEQRNLPLSAMGFYQMLSFGGLALVTVSSGWFADRLIRKGANPVTVRKYFTIAGLVLACSQLLGMQTQSEPLALFISVFSLSSLGLASANCWTLTQTLVPAQSVGRVIGVQNFLANLAGIAAPIVTGWLKESMGTYHGASYMILGVLMMGVVAYVFLVREENAPWRLSSTYLPVH